MNEKHERQKPSLLSKTANTLHILRHIFSMFQNANSIVASIITCHEKEYIQMKAGNKDQRIKQ